MIRHDTIVIPLKISVQGLVLAQLIGLMNGVEATWPIPTQSTAVLLYINNLIRLSGIKFSHESLLVYSIIALDCQCMTLLNTNIPHGLVKIDGGLGQTIFIFLIRSR